MTDEQILNALKSCGDSIAICDDCPYEGRNHCSLLAKHDIIERFNALKAENAALRERLDKAVELPFHPDDYHMEIGISKIIESPCDQSCRISIPIYVYVKCDSLEAAVSLFAELKGGEK